MDRLVVYVARRKVVCRCCEDSIDRGAIHSKDDLGMRCLACVGLDDLVLLPPGDAALTRRATRASRTSAIVHEQHRRRFRRVGTLVEPGALLRAEFACVLDAAARREKREREGPGV
ncbi:MAG TPA: hypothetical protein VGH87_11795 [Polyangiaceae bacterium]|jgi:hypothetical protein